MTGEASSIGSSESIDIAETKPRIYEIWNFKGGSTVKSRVPDNRCKK